MICHVLEEAFVRHLLNDCTDQCPPMSGIEVFCAYSMGKNDDLNFVKRLRETKVDAKSTHSKFTRRGIHAG